MIDLLMGNFWMIYDIIRHFIFVKVDALHLLFVTEPLDRSRFDRGTSPPITDVGDLKGRLIFCVPSSVSISPVVETISWDVGIRDVHTRSTI